MLARQLVNLTNTLLFIIGVLLSYQEKKHFELLIIYITKI